MPELKQFMFLNVLKGFNPATSVHIKILIFRHSEQFLELILRADCRESHCTHCAGASDGATVRFCR